MLLYRIHDSVTAPEHRKHSLAISLPDLPKLNFGFVQRYLGNVEEIGKMQCTSLTELRSNEIKKGFGGNIARRFRAMDGKRAVPTESQS